MENILKIYIWFFFQLLFGNCQKKTWTFGKRFSAGLMKVHSTCLEEKFDGKHSFWKINPYTKWFSELQRKIFGSVVENFRQGCQNCVLHFQRIVSRRNNILKKNKVSSFPDFKRNIFKVPEKIFQQSCQSCNLRVRGKFRMENIFFGN